MQAYLNLLREIREHGMHKVPVRVAEGRTVEPTYGLPNLHFEHNLADGFPLLTTRRLAWVNMRGELRSFLEGRTTLAGFHQNKCVFWDKWAREDGTLGPVYGAQWLAHGQLDHVLKCLRESPYDRRMVVSAWRPDEHKYMVLPPCHILFCVTVYNSHVNLAWIQRSCDFPVGVPYNIASYALLCHLFAKWAGLKPGKISALFCDAHIYHNQIEQVDVQLRRVCRKLPEVSVGFVDDNNFNSWTASLFDYIPYPPLDFAVEV